MFTAKIILFGLPIYEARLRVDMVELQIPFVNQTKWELQKAVWGGALCFSAEI